MVMEQRKQMPRLGGRKLLKVLEPSFPEELKVGRDTFFNFLRDRGLLIRKRRTKVYTTNSSHWLRKYDNLIKDFIPTAPGQLWVSDITYIEIKEGFAYLSLITDAYSRKIVGWSLGETLEAKYSISALKMALKQRKENTNLYHHSDRGIQYCSDGYVKLLKKHDIKISMTENGDPLENAIAERVNGILKGEWLNDLKLKSKEQAENQIKKIIYTYNHFRPHGSINMLTPYKAHLQSGMLRRRWKNYYKNKLQTVEY